MTTTTREFVLPDLGEGLTEAEIVRWLVAEGDQVDVDQPVVEVETAKAVVEVPCPYPGVVVRLWGRAGDSLDVGQPLVSVRERRGAEEEEPAAGDSGSVLVGYGTSAPATRRRRIRTG
ncbi:biotin/lipoyl-containing protein, partial [Streptomyces sp. NPDC023723]|uniref:biotin/lipoyl-containing protein n=1 Tax=Streptomyces sp. NPDC023723 TaxID=3154323 RepID=UPI00340589C1